MAQYTDISGIKFNSVNVDVLPRTKSIGNKDIVDATSEDLTDIAAENGGKLPSTVNAVEIDWNGAQVAGKTLNTTGEVLTLIGDNNANIATLKQHSHANYATQTYVTDKIKEASISGGGSGLDVEDYTDGSVNYNLLVAPEGSKYTELGSLNNGSDWCSDLWAGVDENGYVTLYSSKFNGELIGEHKHSHANYATQTYVTDKIKEASISGGGNGLDVEDYTDGTVNYNLLVAPEGSKYTELGSLSDGGTWTSQLYATVDVSNSESTLYSTYFEGKFRGELPHAHTNYVTVTSFNSRIKNLESRIEYLESYLSYIFDEGTDVPSTPTIPAITDIKVNVSGGLYGSGEETTLDETFYMTSYEGEISEDNLKFTLTAVPSNANATFAIKYSKNSDGDVQDTFVDVTTSTITNGLIVNVTPDDLFDDTDWTEYTITANNGNSTASGTLRIEFSYLGDESEDSGKPAIIDQYVYFGTQIPSAIDNSTVAAPGGKIIHNQYNFTVNTTDGTTYYLAAPKQALVSCIDTDGYGAQAGWLTPDVKDKIAGYTIYKYTGNGLTWNVSVTVSTYES